MGLTEKARESLGSVKKWETVGHPGFFGKKRDEQFIEWDNSYGGGNWRIVWRLKDEQLLDFERVFWQGYVASYAGYFYQHPDEAEFLVENYSYAYDKETISKKEAFNPYALYRKPDRPNQFHHVALNIALEWFVGKSFGGEEPIKVREGKPGTSQSSWPEGWRWSPGRIPVVRRDLIPKTNISGWWQKGTMEDLYQSAKVLQVRRNSVK